MEVIGIKKILFIPFVLTLIFVLLLVPVSAEETDVPDENVETTTEAAVPEESFPINQELRDSEDYNTTKGSFYDTVYTLWYWIFGDCFTTSDKVCCILSVITIVWMMYLIIPGKKR